MPKKGSPAAHDDRRLALLFRQGYTASAVAAASAVACTLVWLQAAPGPGPSAWLLAVMGASLLRFRLFRRFFADGAPRPAGERDWLRQHAFTAALVGLAWGSVPLVPLDGAPAYLRQLQTVVPAFVLMAAITSYGVYFSQYLVLWGAACLTTLATRLYVSGWDGVPEALMFALFAPLLALTARRYADSLLASDAARQRSEELVQQLTAANEELHRHNATLAQQHDLITQEEALARHVFRQLTLGGDHRLAGVHTWNQSMGSLSGDLTQTARGPAGQTFVFLGDFTGHGLPAALGALPASAVFLAMAAKGLPLEAIAAELNRKLRQLLPVGYFCCAALLELSADRRRVQVWNGGLPAVLVRRRGVAAFERVDSHSLPLGVVDGAGFDPAARDLTLGDGDLLYAYTDGLTEAENVHGERWGTRRLEDFLLRPDLPTPRLPALIDAVLDHVNLAPASDDISVVEIEAAPAAAQADAA